MTAVHAPRSVPARYPPYGAWPIELPAEMAAALLGFETTGKLYKAIARNEAPRPTATRLRDGRRVPVWALDACRKFVANRHEIRSDAAMEAKSIADDI
jgi:hypothetical protein